MTVATVVCIKWGDKYPPQHVNRLYAGVKRFMKRKFRFLCFTERPEGIIPEVEIRPLPVEPFDAVLVELMDRAAAKAKKMRWGAWRKVSLYRPGLIDGNGPVLGLDIDVVITGGLDEIFDYAPGKVCMRQDWQAERQRRPHGNSSVFRFDPALHGYIYEEFAADPWACAQRANGREQEHTSMTALAHGDFEYLPREWISSFKLDSIPPRPLNWFIAPRLPPQTRVMCFYGPTKMERAIKGTFLRRTRASLPARWLRSYWLQEPDQPK